MDSASVLLSIIKNGNASTLDVVNRVKEALQDGPRRRAGRAQDHGTVRPVGVRHPVGGRRVARRRDCRGAHRADDPAVPRLMAVDAGGDDLDPAVHPHVVGRSVFSRRYAQHDDARRARARGRHSGRQFDGDDREYPPSAHRGGQAAARGDAPRRRRHRGADPGVDARHQLRVHVGGFPRGPLEISVHAARARGGVRDARVLWAVADADADHHRPAAQGRAP